MAALKAAIAIAGLAVCEGFSLGAAPVRVAPVRYAPAIFMDETILEKALAGELEAEGFENCFLSEVGWADYLDKNAKSSYNMNERPSLAADGYYTASILDSPVQGEPASAPATTSARRGGVHLGVIGRCTPLCDDDMACCRASHRPAPTYPGQCWVETSRTIRFLPRLTKPTCASFAVLSDWLVGVKAAITAPVATAFPTITNDISGARSYPDGYDEVSARTIKPKVKDFSESIRITGIEGFNAFGTPSSKQTGNIWDSLPWNKE